MRELRNTSLKECVDEIFLFLKLESNDDEGWNAILEEWNDEKRMGRNRKYVVEDNEVEQNVKSGKNPGKSKKMESEVLKEALIRIQERKDIISKLPYRQRYVMRLAYRIVKEKDGSEMDLVRTEGNINNFGKSDKAVDARNDVDELDFLNPAHLNFFKIQQVAFAVYVFLASYFFINGNLPFFFLVSHSYQLTPPTRACMSADRILWNTPSSKATEPKPSRRMLRMDAM
jgi:hypothetical protein